MWLSSEIWEHLMMPLWSICLEGIATNSQSIKELMMLSVFQSLLFVLRVLLETFYRRFFTWKYFGLRSSNELFLLILKFAIKHNSVMERKNFLSCLTLSTLQEKNSQNFMKWIWNVSYFTDTCHDVFIKNEFFNNCEISHVEKG